MSTLLRPSVAAVRPLGLTDRIGTAATQALHLELDTWPKPGLVSPLDPGSHRDMDAGTLRRSIAAVSPFLADLTNAGAMAAGMSTLRCIGLAAETAMLRATGGVNTHRGVIFGLGLLCAAAGAVASGLESPSACLGDVVRRRWGPQILDGPIDPRTHGAAVGQRYGAGGARLEAATGFLTLYKIGLPALAAGFALSGGDAEAARIQACFALIAVLEDTNLLHRGGQAGLDFARREARHFLEAGGVGGMGWRNRAALIHQAFVSRRLSPGGSADLLAMTLFVRSVEGRPGGAAP